VLKANSLTTALNQQSLHRPQVARSQATPFQATAFKRSVSPVTKSQTPFKPCCAEPKRQPQHKKQRQQVAAAHSLPHAPGQRMTSLIHTSPLFCMARLLQST